MKAGDFYLFKEVNYGPFVIDTIGILNRKTEFYSDKYYCYWITPNPRFPERSMANASNGETCLYNGKFILPKEFLL